MLSLGYHPPGFSEAYTQRLEGALAHIDRYLAANDSGPVVYVTMSELVAAWPVPQQMQGR